MRNVRLIILSIAALVTLATLALSAPEGWHTSMKDGLEASSKSGKPLLVVTAWKEKV